MTMAPVTVLKRVDGSTDLWSENQTIGRPVSPSGGLVTEFAAEEPLGGITIERVPKGAAKTGDIIRVYGSYFKIDGIVAHPETAGVRVALECSSTNGPFRIADKVALGGDVLTIGEDQVVL